MIELANRPGNVARRWKYAVDRTGLIQRPAQSVRMTAIVNQLVLESDHVDLRSFAGLNYAAVCHVILDRRVDQVFELYSMWLMLRSKEYGHLLDAIFHAAVAAFRDLPIERQLEILIRLLADQVLRNQWMRLRGEA